MPRPAKRGLILSAPSSGSGKTTLTLGLPARAQPEGGSRKQCEIRP